MNFTVLRVASSISLGTRPSLKQQDSIADHAENPETQELKETVMSPLMQEGECPEINSVWDALRLLMQ